MRLWKPIEKATDIEILKHIRLLRALSWVVYFIAISGSVVSVVAATGLEYLSREPVLFFLAADGVIMGVFFSVSMFLLSVIMDRKVEFMKLFLDSRSKDRRLNLLTLRVEALEAKA